MKLFLFFAMLLGAVASPALAADPARYMTAELVAETLSPAPGTTILVGIRMRPKAGWHGYWSNPGDAGFPTSVDWEAPRGVKFGPLLHPSPKLLNADGISSFAHEGEHVLLSRMTVPSGLEQGTSLPIRAQLSWAACTATMCVPLKATLALDLTAGSGEKSSHAALIRTAWARLPKAAPNGTYGRDRGAVRLTLPPALKLNIATTRFFPDDNDAFRTVEGRVSSEAGRIVIAGRASSDRVDPISGVVTDGRAAYRLNFVQGTPVVSAHEPKAAPAPHPPPAAGVARAPEAATNARGTASQPANPQATGIGWVLAVLAAATVAGAAYLLRSRARHPR